MSTTGTATPIVQPPVPANGTAPTLPSRIQPGGRDALGSSNLGTFQVNYL